MAISTFMKLEQTRDRDGNRGGIIEYVQKGLICKRWLYNYKTGFTTTISELIFSESRVSSKKWFYMSIYCP